MARPSKLSVEQCERIKMLKNEGISAPKLAKRFHLSESSVYKILNGTYVAGETGTLPPLADPIDTGSTESLFNKNKTQEDISNRVIKAATAGRHVPVDEVTLAAAELIIAQARYEAANKHR